MLRSEIPVYRYHFMSHLNGVNVQDASKMRVKLNFGHAATLDTSNNTYMLAVESLAFNTLDENYRNTYALYISNTGYNSTRCTSDDNPTALTSGKIPVLICGKQGVNLGPMIRSSMGFVISNPNFLNDTIDIQLLDGACGPFPDINQILWFSGTFVVYKYVPA
jgi:hypothetical protein